MVYFSGDDNDDGLRPFDFDEVLQEARNHESLIAEATGERYIQVGIHNSDAYDFEVWADGGRFGVKTVYFTDFEELRKEVKLLYPEADWAEVGW
jgi:hypothetical protein